MSQEKAKKLYQLIYTDLIRLIMLVRFRAERYFFMFINDNMYIAKT